nr:hypothetical protein GTC16762_12460 [Pigmentibacter ruber]
MLTANYVNLGKDISDIMHTKYTKQLLIAKKIATIPLSAFYLQSSRKFYWVRFAFCKKKKLLKKLVNYYESICLISK